MSVKIIRDTNLHVYTHQLDVAITHTSLDVDHSQAQLLCDCAKCVESLGPDCLLLFRQLGFGFLPGCFSIGQFVLAITQLACDIGNTCFELEVRYTTNQ